MSTTRVVFQVVNAFLILFTSCCLTSSQGPSALTLTLPVLVLPFLVLLNRHVERKKRPAVELCLGRPACTWESLHMSSPEARGVEKARGNVDQAP